jgi:hypothetical protein
MADAIGGEGTVEDKKQEKGEDGNVRRWLKEIDLSERTEKDWYSAVRNLLKVYNGDSFRDQEHTKRKETFNILWSNVETKRPSLYNSLPRPDIRRRFRDENPLGKVVSELLERCASFTIEDGFEEEVVAGVNDMLLPGRAVTRLNYVPTIEEEEVVYQEITFAQVQWDDFRRGAGRRWTEVPWVAFRHKFTKDQFKARFPDFVDNVTFTESAGEQDDNLDKTDKTDKTIFKRTDVWEIWDKEEKEVVFISTSYKDKALETQDDPLGFRNFFPVPRPMYAIESSTSLIPTAEYTMYETLAKELELITNRLNRIIDGLRLRGVYDASLSEIEKLFDEQDNGFIPAEDISRLVETGGLDKAIWMLPIREMAEVLTHLYARRDSLVQEIYQITGISDLQRGQTKAEETLGAQQLKADFGSQRLQRQQREVQRYIRDLIRMATELIAENFSPEMLSQMSGMQFPTAEQKQAQMQEWQAAAAMAQQNQQPPPPQPEDVPSWDDIMGVLKSDVLRAFLVDIETDSTIQAQQQQDEESITKLLTGIVQFMQGMGPVIESGVMSMEAGKAIMMASVRRFRLGREVEDALEQMGAEHQEQANPEDQAAQAEMQMKQQEMQANMQMSQAENQAKMQELQMQTAQMQQEAQYAAAEHQQKMQELGLKRQAAMEKHQMDMQKIRATPKASNG